MTSADPRAALHQFVDRLPVELKGELTAAIDALGYDKKRSLIAAKLLECVWLHIFAHEFSHIYRGHLDYFIGSGLGDRLLEPALRHANDVTDYRAIEHMADLSASWSSSSTMMVTAASLAPQYTKIAMLILLRLWSFAVSVCYLIDDHIREEEEPLYPPAIDRADAAVRVVKVTMAEKLGLSQQRLSTALSKGVRDALKAWDLAGWSRRASDPSYYENNELLNSIKKIESSLRPPPDMWPGAP
ncbi:hypothetical protein N185_30560 [Sinorhizobium sp. GW3]|nr:hypothetical protein N185_30560 [Sinorhizobium sp. GW3]